MFQIDLQKILKWFEEKWHSRFSIILLIVIIFFVLITFFSKVEFSNINIIEWIIIGITISIVSIIWLYTTKIPKTPSKKIGFIVAIYTENKEQFKKLKNDLIENMREYILKGDLNQFSLLIYPEYHSRKILDLTTASNYLHHSKAHFMLYGRSRERYIDGKKHFVLNLEGAVSHKPIPMKTSKELAKEFRELLPRRLAISEENDLFTFEIVSEWVNLIAKYIIGIAAILSNNWIYAKNLFESIKDETKNLKSNFPSVIKIKHRLPHRLIEVLFQMAAEKYLLYRKTKKNEHLDEMGDHLTEIKNYSYQDYHANLLRAIFYFLRNRDVESAMKEIKRCSKNRDGTWLFSYAFLKAYEGDLKSATRAYKNTFNRSYYNSVPLESEEFIIEIIGEEPEKYQLYFCLGLINYFAKNDSASAKRDFELFLSKSNENEYIEQVELAEKYISQIHMKLDN